MSTIRTRYPRVSVALGLLLALLAVTAVAVGCGDTGATTTTGGGTAETTVVDVTTGGVLRVATQPGNADFDPALFAGNPADIQLQHQVLEKLVSLNQEFGLEPTLATEWNSEDGTVWTFTLREGVTFSNGSPFTADDVVYTMDRLRDPAVGSAMVEVYSNIDTITADDPTHVTFTLKTPDGEFPRSLTDYRTLMLSKDVDPAKELVGTGPFVLESISAETGGVLKKNPTYWGTDEKGNKLPYLDEVRFVYSPDMAGQIEGLQGGSIDWVGGLTSELKQTVEANAGFKTISAATNYCFELQIRTDVEPGSKLEFRQAIMAGTDRQAIVDLVAPGMADPGNGTLVGPGYADYYSAESVPYDTAKAKELLATAGYSDGVDIKLVVQGSDVMPAIATAWQAQMKEIGINVEIVQVPSDVFYTEEGEDNWYQAPFSIVDWGTRAAPITYFQLALTSEASWNYSRWKNAEFDTLAKQIVAELDSAKRADYYKQAQTILQTEVPMMNFLVNEGVAGQPANLEGIALAPDWPQTLFRTANFTQ
ncbi:MAG: ABC transporter substrate-binding protein [Thermoleophilia bacterium]